MDTYDYDLGQHGFTVSTTSPDAQRWFDRGLNWTYNYNHEEAVVCFQKAAKADPNCAMAHWGIAYAAGPNYNMWWEHFDDAGRAEALATSFAATQAAMDCLANTTEVEAALIRALPARYPQETVTDIDTMETWNDAFADAMRTAHAAHPDSLEVTTIFAESLLNRFPWNMWNLPAAAPTEGADTLECEAILERAMANDPAAMHHPGLLHLYVHLMEMSPYPEKALKAGDALRTLMPDGGHLIHMPTHIDVLCGHYENVRALESGCDRRGHEVLRTRGPLQHLHRLPHPQLPFRDLRRAFPRTDAARARRQSRHPRHLPRGNAPRPIAPHGGLF